MEHRVRGGVGRDADFDRRRAPQHADPGLDLRLCAAVFRACGACVDGVPEKEYYSER